jgi:hypothetical protein
MQATRKRYMRDGTPIHRTALLNDRDYAIINRYQGEHRGLVNYYGLAHNFAKLGYGGHTMDTARLKTLASKNQTSVMQEANRLKATEKTAAGPRKCLRVTSQRVGKKPLVARFGGLSLKRCQNPVIKDQRFLPYVRMRSERVERLLNDTCEGCAAQENGQMHHSRKLRDLNKTGKREMPLWMKIMISRQRQSIPLCKKCHDTIHHNRPTSTRQGNRRAG